MGLPFLTPAWTDRDVERALAEVPREEFVPPELRAEAREDRALPIAFGQSISQPSVVSHMTHLASVKPGDRVLEIGTGTGYQAAVLAQLGAEVYSVERIPELAEAAAHRLNRLGYRVVVRCGDGGEGWPEASPFAAILVTAAADQVPPRLLEQLACPGRLVIPVGPHRGDQRLLVLSKDSQGRIRQSETWAVRFVPLIVGGSG